MTSSEATRRLRESEERIYDPSTIDAKLSSLTTDQRGTLWRLYRSSRSALTQGEVKTRLTMIRLFKKTAEDIEADVALAFSRMGSDAWDYQQVRRVGRDRELLTQVNDRIKALGAETKDSLSDMLVGQYKQAWLDSAYRLDSLTPASINIKMGLLPDREIAAMLDQPWSGARFSDRLGHISDEMASTIRSQIVRSMMSQESWQETARRIRGKMGATGQTAVWRAEMVARTELAHAQTVANTRLYDENKDVVEKVVWVAHPGACLKCRSKHGKPVSVVGYPPEDSHPNCVCDILAVPKSFSRLAAPNDPGFTEPPSRSSWVDDNSDALMLQ